MFDLLPCLPPQNLRYWGNWWRAHFTCTNIVGGFQKSNTPPKYLKRKLSYDDEVLDQGVGGINWVKISGGNLLKK